MDLITKINSIISGDNILEGSYKCPQCGRTFKTEKPGKKKCFKCGENCKEETNESSPTSSTENHINWWGRTTQIYLSPNNEVRWSPSWEFPPGYIMTEEEVIEAKRRGYVIIPWS